MQTWIVYHAAGRGISFVTPCRSEDDARAIRWRVATATGRDTYVVGRSLSLDDTRDALTARAVCDALKDMGHRVTHVYNTGPHDVYGGPRPWRAKH